MHGASKSGFGISGDFPLPSRPFHEIQQAFYASLSRGRTTGEALADAQQVVRSKRGNTHPRDRAGFALLGDPMTRVSLDAGRGGKNAARR